MTKPSTSSKHFVVLTGGTGGAKFVQGLQTAVGGRQLTVIVNTGDDLRWWNLHVSPDVDSVTYALAGLLSRERGWGVDGDTFQCLEQMRRLGAPGWFQIGDRDLALHLTRTHLLDSGKTLTEATRQIAARLEIAARILPMCDSRVETRVLVDDGELSFQEYFVRDRYRHRVKSVRFDGAASARPAAGVVEAIGEATAVFIAPSNPITSIGPILAIPGIAEALQRTAAPVVAVSPIVGGEAVSGPAGELMRAHGLPVSLSGVARCYRHFLDVLVADQQDRGATLDAENVDLVFTDTMMRSDAVKLNLAEAAIAAARRASDQPVLPAPSEYSRATKRSLTENGRPRSIAHRPRKEC